MWTGVSPKRPRILRWRRHGKAGGCQFKKNKAKAFKIKRAFQKDANLHQQGSAVRITGSYQWFEDKRDFVFEWLIKQSKIARKTLTAVHLLPFQCSNSTLKTSYRDKLMKKWYSNIKNQDIREKQTKRKYERSYKTTQVSKDTKGHWYNAIYQWRGQARKSTRWMPWH